MPNDIDPLLQELLDFHDYISDEENIKPLLNESFILAFFSIMAINATIKGFFTLYQNFLSLYWDPIKPIKGTILHHNLTNKFRRIVEDDKVEIYYAKSKSINAFMVGDHRLFVTVPLMQMLDEREIISVLLHEWGHFKGGHVGKLSFTENIISIPLISAMSALMIQFGLPTIIITSLFFKWFGRKISRNTVNVILGRRYEYYADSYAAKYGYGQDLIHALRKIDEYFRDIICKDLSEEECQLTMSQGSLFDEHPSLKRRISNILKTKIVKMNKLIDDKSDTVNIKRAFFIIKKYNEIIDKKILDDQIDEMIQ